MNLNKVNITNDELLELIKDTARELLETYGEYNSDCYHDRIYGNDSGIIPVPKTLEGVYEITPELAQIFLDNKCTNRVITPANVIALKVHMDGNTFYTTHQGLAFGKDGKLLDGQHRMTALIECGKPQLFTITVYNATTPVGLPIDMGFKRSINTITGLPSSITGPIKAFYEVIDKSLRCHVPIDEIITRVYEILRVKGVQFQSYALAATAESGNCKISEMKKSVFPSAFIFWGFLNNRTSDALDIFQQVARNHPNIDSPNWEIASKLIDYMVKNVVGKADCAKSRRNWYLETYRILSGRKTTPKNLDTYKKEIMNSMRIIMDFSPNS